MLQVVFILVAWALFTKLKINTELWNKPRLISAFSDVPPLQFVSHGSFHTPFLYLKERIHVNAGVALVFVYRKGEKKAELSVKLQPSTLPLSLFFRLELRALYQMSKYNTEILYLYKSVRGHVVTMMCCVFGCGGHLFRVNGKMQHIVLSCVLFHSNRIAHPSIYIGWVVYQVLLITVFAFLLCCCCCCCCLQSRWL